MKSEHPFTMRLKIVVLFIVLAATADPEVYSSTLISSSLKPTCNEDCSSNYNWLQNLLFLNQKKATSYFHACLGDKGSYSGLFPVPCKEILNLESSCVIPILKNHQNRWENVQGLEIMV